MAEYICPICHSKNIVPLFAKENRWTCLDCGYEGLPQEIIDRLEYFWEDYKKVENKYKKPN
ncbi:hypothetical protein MJ1_0331 [Nanobdella aerobiophila]|uniref:Uncharacterized protein n=1 Tax=Nanobdella aerobiophila TaxID=2586965 RepID=A0A915SKQ3_9ARCH|nr:hypothetical protein [Nanobdella aerobiophila]BBL45496.1 hypothetical protein MJ1_0331 [Nanobdella aerobiophila]